MAVARPRGHPGKRLDAAESANLNASDNDPCHSAPCLSGPFYTAMTVSDFQINGIMVVPSAACPILFTVNQAN
jgi:hypothetical protein